MRKKKQQKDGDINYKKLFFELMSVLLVIFIITIIILFSFLNGLGVFSDEKRFAAFDDLLELVDNYDSSNGRDLDLEKRLDENYYADVQNWTKTFYFGLASAVYYCEIGYYNTSEQIFNALYQNIPKGERPRNDLETRDVICRRKMAKHGIQF